MGAIAVRCGLTVTCCFVVPLDVDCVQEDRVLCECVRMCKRSPCRARGTPNQLFGGLQTFSSLPAVLCEQE